MLLLVLVQHDFIVMFVLQKIPIAGGSSSYIYIIQLYSWLTSSLFIIYKRYLFIYLLYETETQHFQQQHWGIYEDIYSNEYFKWKYIKYACDMKYLL